MEKSKKVYCICRQELHVFRVVGQKNGKILLFPLDCFSSYDYDFNTIEKELDAEKIDGDFNDRYDVIF